MRFIIDTSTWVSLVRYYKPFDDSLTIYNFFKQKLTSGEFLLIDGVSSECKFVSKRIVSKELDFISDKNFICKTNELLPTPKYFRLLDNQFCNQHQKRKLTKTEIEESISEFLKSADSKIIMKAIEISKSLEGIVVVTEESNSDNDNKLFKKIPLMCQIINIECIGLPKLMKKYDDEISILVK